VQHKIRFSAIDALERDQPFGAVSKKRLSQLAAGKVAEAHCHKKDRYQRHICIVYFDGKDLPLAQLDAGLAWVYRKYSGEHVRLLRTYRGKYILWWMDTAGELDEDYKNIDAIVRARNLPSMQLAGYQDHRTQDLNSLTDMGVKVVGRLAGINQGKLQFSGSLRNVCALADLTRNRLLNAIEEWAAENGLSGEVEASHRFASTEVEGSPPLLIDIARSGIKTIIWAAGFRPDYSWLDIPVLEPKGYIRHDGGVVTDSPGQCVIGMPFLRRRKSTLIDGVGDDARDVSAHLAARAARPCQPTTDATSCHALAAPG
jgi:hypothetical protein